jgi:hypothetical protein
MLNRITTTIPYSALILSCMTLRYCDYVNGGRVCMPVWYRRGHTCARFMGWLAGWLAAPFICFVSAAKASVLY